METESPYLAIFGFVWRVETDSPQIFKNLDECRRVETESLQVFRRSHVFRRVETDSPLDSEGPLTFSVL